MSVLYRLVVGSLAVVGFTSVGGGLWSFMAPEQEQLLEVRRREIKASPVMMAGLRTQSEIVLKALKDSAETNENLTSKPQ